ncbi:protein arginine N-methyltransferase 7-like [Tubulanus polymorphus]|uniref:protein arginine N-methyltransferase 7-like n=1 Tax=Tubulanus polymorphus TaxID=672921 RepID=UPI003DA45B07
MSNDMSYVFRSTCNPVTGQQDWVVEDENFDYNQEIARSAYADMLHDTERNKKYDIALRKAIEEMHRRGKPANVLDIGTGTGLLSMMAVRSGADSVTACEAFTPMADCARKVIEENGFGGKILLIPKRSTDIEVGIGGDMTQRANILVTEVFDTELIGEGGISTFNHAHKYLLDDDCIVVPSRGRMYMQVVDSQLVERWHNLKRIKVNDSASIEIPAEVRQCLGVASVHDIQLDQLRTDQFTPITKPEKIFDFDFTGKPLLQEDRCSVKTVLAENSGLCHGIFMWWDLDMDQCGDVLLSCAPRWAHPEPEKMPWRDHWMQACYYPRKIVGVDKGEQIRIHGCHDEYSLWFDVSKQESGENSAPERPVCRCRAHIAFSRSRIQSLNNQTTYDKYIKALEKVITSESVCVSLSDGSYLPLIAAKLGCKKVLTVESNLLSKKVLQSYANTNNLGNFVTIFDSLELMNEHIENQNLKIDVIVGEPFFYSSLLPWHNLHFWYGASTILEHSSPDVHIIPKSATMKCVALDFDDLGKIRAPVGICEGFNLDTFDKTIAKASDLVDALVEPQPLWEYPSIALTAVSDVISFDFKKNVYHTFTEKCTKKLEFERKGRCNGVAFWMEYELDDDEHVSRGTLKPLNVGNKPTWDIETQQGVHLLKQPFNVQVGAALNIDVEFKPDNGDVKFSFK